MRLQPPVAYQGGKGRIADEIVDAIDIPDGAVFCDLCCGSGAVSLALMERGFSPDRIVLVDKGPWGDFWNAVGKCRFDCDLFGSMLGQIPSERREVKAHMERLASTSAPDRADSVYIFLVLQAGSFGGKAITVREGRWVSCGSRPTFRDYWTPRPGCNRKSPVNPMMPMPETLEDRVRLIVERCGGVKGCRSDILDFDPPEGAVVYIDPPYKGTTAYSDGGFDVVQVAKGLGRRCYISERCALGGRAFRLSAGRRKGGISGKRRTAHEEWVSVFNEEVSDADGEKAVQ